MSATISVLLVDDHALLRETLRDRLDAEPDLKVVGTAGSAEAGLACVADVCPNVVLMDIDMPGQSCFGAARRFKELCPDASILFLSAFFHDRYIESALAAQATGYITKDEPPARIVDAVRAAASDLAFFSPKVQERIVIDGEGVRLAEAGRSLVSMLTTRELEVLRYLARGLSKKEVAGLMEVSVKTVSRHTENLMEKLDIHDRVELARFAIREGLAEP